MWYLVCTLYQRLLSFLFWILMHLLYVKRHWFKAANLKHLLEVFVLPFLWQLLTLLSWELSVDIYFWNICLSHTFLNWLLFEVKCQVLLSILVILWLLLLVLLSWNLQYLPVFGNDLVILLELRGHKVLLINTTLFIN
jgi:hypothetical protein